MLKLIGFKQKSEIQKLLISNEHARLVKSMLFKTFIKTLTSSAVVRMSNETLSVITSIKLRIRSIKLTQSDVKVSKLKAIEFAIRLLIDCEASKKIQ